MDCDSSGDPMTALDDELAAALENAEDDEATFHIRQAMQHAVALREQQDG